MQREKTTRIQFMCPDKMLHALKIAAKRQKRTESSVLREALSLYLGVEDTVKVGGRFEKRGA